MLKELFRFLIFGSLFSEGFYAKIHGLTLWRTFSRCACVWGGGEGVLSQVYGICQLYGSKVEQQPPLLLCPSGTDEFVKDMLQQHNKYRKTHNSVELQLDVDMCKQADKYAQQLADQGIAALVGSLKHSPKSTRLGQGENLFAGCKSDIKGADITTVW